MSITTQSQGSGVEGTAPLLADRPGAAGASPVLPDSGLAPAPGVRRSHAATLSAHGWIVFGVVGLLTLGAYYLLASPAEQDLAYDLYGLAAAGAILVGVRAYRPVRRDAWLLLALGVALQAAGDLTITLLTGPDGSEPFPSVADALYIAGYVALAAGIVQLVARDGRPRDPAAWIDALIIAGAATIVGWSLVFAQYLADPALSPLALVVSVAYPFMDILLLAVVAHLLLVSGRGQLSLALLGLGLLANLFADTWYIFLSLDGAYETGQLVDAGWLIGYLAIGAAALHPSMGRAGDPPEAAWISNGALSRRRLALIACGALVAPGAAFGAVVRGSALDVPSTLVGSGFIYLLVVYRVVLSMRRQRELMEDRSRLAQAIEQAPDMIWLTDASGAVQYANPAFARMSGLDAARLVGRPLHGMLGTEMRAPETEPEIAAALARGESWAGLVVVPRAPGSGLQVDLSASPIRDPRGRVTGWTHVARDVTRERAMESDLALGVSVRAALESTLRGYASGTSVDEAAQSVCDAIATLPGIDTVAVESFENADDVVMLAVHARPDFPARPATRLPVGRARYLRERAAHGAWAEAWDPRPEDGAWSQGIADFGVRAVAFSPIMHGDHVDGVLAVGTTDPGFVRTLVDRLPSVADFSTAPSMLLGERLHVHRHHAERRRELATLLDERAFSPVFQPIVELETREVVGYEALTRFDSQQPPDLCFRDAWDVGLGPDLELATLQASIAEARALPAGRWLNLNVAPRLLENAAPLDRLLRLTDRPVVLEITEHEAVADYARLREAVRSLGQNVWLAVDDAGAGIANFGHIVELRPDFVKLDISLVRGVNTDVGRQALVVAMHHFARTAGCHLVAEGIEDEQEAGTLLGLGVEYGQGYVLGRPAPAAAWSTPRRNPRPLRKVS